MSKTTTGAIISTLVVVSLFYLPVIDLYLTFYSVPFLDAIDQGSFDPWFFFSFFLSITFGFFIAFVVILVGRRALKWIEILPPAFIPGLGVGSLTILINGHDPLLMGSFLGAFSVPLIVVVFIKMQSKDAIHVE